MTYIPTALSSREDQALRRYAMGRVVVEAGALLGHSTIQLARTAKRVTSIDRHSGYTYWPNDTLRSFNRNMEVAGVANRVQSIVGDFSLLAHFPAHFARRPQFSDAEKAEIARLYLRERVKQTELARELGVPQGSISRIIASTHLSRGLANE